MRSWYVSAAPLLVPNILSGFQICEKLKEYCSTLTGDVNVVHVGGGDLLTNLCDQIQDELNVISLTLLRVNIPRRGILPFIIVTF